MSVAKPAEPPGFWSVSLTDMRMTVILSALNTFCASVARPMPYASPSSTTMTLSPFFNLSVLTM